MFIPDPSKKRLVPAFIHNKKTDPTGHGTCMASKAAGSNYGIAKNANLVFVKHPPSQDPSLAARDALEFDSFLTGLTMILDDVIKYKLQGKAVVNFSFGCKSGVTDSSSIFYYR